MGPLPKGKGGCRFIVVVVDYFTKWAEADALAKITVGDVQSFLWKSVVCRHGIPHTFVTDNSTQFHCYSFRKWCTKLGIRHNFSTSLRPQANGKVEATNKTLLTILKKNLENRKGAWVDFLPEVLWSYWTTTQTPIGATSFSLTFGAEAVIPIVVESLSYRVSHYNLGLNSEGLQLHLDLLEEQWDKAQLTMVAYQRKTELYFNKTVQQ